MKHLALGLLAAAFSSTAFANSNCDKPRNDFDGLYCPNKVYGEADKELNERYAALVKMIDADGRARLKSSQLEWPSGSQCQLFATRRDRVPGRPAMRATRTVERAEFLQSRICECKSAGCQNSKL